VAENCFEWWALNSGGLITSVTRASCVVVTCRLIFGGTQFEFLLAVCCPDRIFVVFFSISW
jgi:hypothetical protein